MMLTRSNPTLRDLLTYVFHEHNVKTVDVAERLAIPYKDAEGVCQRLAAGTDAVLTQVQPDVWTCRTAGRVTELDELLLNTARRGINLNQLLLPEAPTRAVVAPTTERPEAVIQGIVKSLPPAQKRALVVVVAAWRGEKQIKVVHPSKVNVTEGAANVAALQALERRGYAVFTNKQPNEWTVSDVHALAVSVADAIGS